MKIGILSDTHGRFGIAIQAVQQLQALGAEYLIHCGDVGDDRVLDALAGMPSAFVFGNTDYDHDGLRTYAGTIGVTCLGASGVLTLAGKTVAVTHGDDARIMSRFQRAGHHYLLTGHTHLRHDRRMEGTRWINPGALYRAAVKSVALLDLATDMLDFVTIPEA